MQPNHGELDRRRFLKSMGAVGVGGVLADLGLFDRMANGYVGAPGKRPNLIVLLVDELRFPSVFPKGIETPAQFLRTFMPNVYELWRHGVRFTEHHTAGNACSPARASLVTGLYPHQQWLLVTRTPQGPSLRPGFPTYGKLLRDLGYRTPYIGKWHLSNTPPGGGTTGYLDRYGFDGQTSPDPMGTNGQGAATDPDIASQAASWLEQRSRTAQPYCLTVGFVNPHDRQFFWGGTEGDRYEQLFAGASVQPYVTGYQSVPSEDAPPALGYPAVPPNWESGTALERHGKPAAQTFFREFQQLVWGAASDDPRATGFTVEPSPIQPGQYGLGVAPYSYWSRGLDLYAHIMSMLDEQVGRVVASVPRDQLDDTVIVFLSDHGEYNGAHGFLSGKVGTAYEEAWHVPLIVADPSGRFTRRTDVPRRQLTSSVDFLPMLVTLGNGGSRSWMRGRLRELYGDRLDLARLLRDPRAPGRDHLVFATDEVAPAALNPTNAPTHLLGVRTRDAKLCTYSHWKPGTARPLRRTMQVEYYDYSTAAGRAEMESTPDDPRANELLGRLLHRYVPQEMQAPLPTPALRRAARRAFRDYLAFVELANGYSVQELLEEQKLASVLDYGLNM
jgi:arylsulfatase A-like enzyme